MIETTGACQHVRTSHITRRGTFDYVYEVCDDCRAERLQNEEGDGYSRWLPAEDGDWQGAQCESRTLTSSLPTNHL